MNPSSREIPTSLSGSSLLPAAIAGDPARIERWLGGFLEEGGVPRSGPVADWWGWISELDRARRAGQREWPESLLERVRALVLAALRFSRPDGSAVFGPADVPADRASVLRRWAEALDDPGLAKVSRWWFGRRGARGAEGPPPLPAFGSDSRPLAMLRADWGRQGDFLAIDGRERGAATAIEVQAAGRTLLGPRWSAADGSAGRARGRGYATGPNADWAEWSFPVGAAKVVRTAVLLRGRQMALLADEWHKAEGVVTARVAVAGGVTTAPIVGSRAIALKWPGGGARAIPLGLPALPYLTDRGSFSAEAGELLLSQRAEARRAWLPLLVSWDKARNRRAATWRVLTVSERSKACPPGVAFAARVGWGPGDGLVVYRSLARPALRTFLGHQTSARFLVGLFNERGDVWPLLKVE